MNQASMPQAVLHQRVMQQRFMHHAMRRADAAQIIVAMIESRFTRRS
jgi:hypothetical protein